jgi:hypothetical protein
MAENYLVKVLIPLKGVFFSMPLDGTEQSTVERHLKEYRLISRLSGLGITNMWLKILYVK